MHQRYLKYSVEELAMDRAFIEWCDNDPALEHERWNVWLDQNPSMRDKVEAASNLVRSLKFRSMEISDGKSDLWNRIEGSIDKLETTPKINTRHHVMRWSWVVAASLLALLIARLLLPGYDLVETNNRQEIAYTLPDGSTAHLNDDTAIRLKSDKFKKRRQLKLEGEAFFEVEKGSTFVVETSNGSVEVLGTSFNVYSRGNDLEVHCNSGRVKVATQEGSVILTPGKHVMKNSSGELIEGEFSLDKEGNWTDGKFQFENKPLNRVLEELERQYDVQVQFPGSIANTLYTGFFNDQDLDSALHNICWPLELNYQIDNKEVIIQSQ